MRTVRRKRARENGLEPSGFGGRMSADRRICVKKGTVCIAVIAALVACAAGGYGFYLLKKRTVLPDAPAVPEEMTLSEGSVAAAGLTSIGMLEEIWELGFLEDGLYVEETYLNMGDEVEAGTAVFKVSEESLESARRELEKQVQETALNRRQGAITYESGLIDAQKEMELAAVEAEYAQSVYDNEVAQAQSELDALQSEADEAQKKVDEYTASIGEDYYYTYYEVAQKEAVWKDNAAFLMELYQEWDVETLEDLYKGADTKNGTGYVTNQVQASGTAAGSASGQGSGFANASGSAAESAKSSGESNPGVFFSLETVSEWFAQETVTGAAGSGDESDTAEGGNAGGASKSGAQESKSTASGSDAQAGESGDGSAESGSGAQAGGSGNGSAESGSGAQAGESGGGSAESGSGAQAGESGGGSAENGSGAQAGESAGESAESGSDTSGSENGDDASDGDSGDAADSGEEGGGSGKEEESGGPAASGGSGMPEQATEAGNAGFEKEARDGFGMDGDPENGLGGANVSEDEIRYNIYLAMEEETEESKQAYETALENYENARDTAKAGIAEAQSELIVLQAKLREQQTAYEKAVISAKLTYDLAVSNEENAQMVYEAAVKQLEEEYEALKEEEETAAQNLALFEETIGDGVFYTSAAGTVMMTMVRESQWITQDTVVVAYSNPDTVTIAASVDQADIASVEIGQEAFVLISGYGTYTGKVTSVDPVSSANGSSVTYTVNVRLEGDVSALEANLTAYVYLGLSEEEQERMSGSGAQKGGHSADGEAGMPQGDLSGPDGEGSGADGFLEDDNAGGMPEDAEGGMRDDSGNDMRGGDESGMRDDSGNGMGGGDGDGMRGGFENGGMPEENGFGPSGGGR